MICCILSSVSYAQIQAGSKYIGGTLGGSYSESRSDISTRTFQIKPTAGFFISSNWMLGVGLDYATNYTTSNQHTEYTVDGTTFSTHLNSVRVRTIGIGPLARYYKEILPKVAVFGEGSLGYSRAVTKYDYASRSTDAQGRQITSSTYITNKEAQHLYAGMAPGVVFFPTAKLGIELKTTVLSYSHGIKFGPQDYNTPNVIFDNPQKNFKANFTLAATSIGAGYYF